MFVNYSYIAGFIDADGSIGLRQNGYPHLVVCNTDYAPLNEMMKWTGEGRVIANSRVKQRANHKTLYSWDTSGISAQNVLRKVIPFLIIKKRRAVYGLTWIPKGRGTPRGQPRGNGSTVTAIRVGEGDL